MGILHGSWISQADTGFLFIWGEIWRRTTPIAPGETGSVPAHPYAITATELKTLIQSLLQAHTLQAGVAELLPKMVSAQVNYALPTQVSLASVMPQHSARVEAAESDAETTAEPWLLYPWQIEGLRLDAATAIKFLQGLPLGQTDADQSFLGKDLRFWSHIARWSLDLLARSKFLPRLTRQIAPDPAGSPSDRAITPKGEPLCIADWQPLLDSGVDQARLDRFVHQMPVVCRTAQAPTLNVESSFLRTDLPSEPRPLIQAFLSGMINAQVKRVASRHTPPTAKRETGLEPWLQALGTETGVMSADPALIDRLETSLQTWTAPIQQYLKGQGAFRTCFYLHPPGYGQSDWSLEYFLQAVDTPTFLIDAKTVWNHAVERLEYHGRTIDRPQETLLAGLGLASRLYPLIEPSLQQQRPQFCRINALQTYEFVKAVSWRLQDSGFGAILPPGLSQQEGWASRLGLTIRAETPKLSKAARLGLQSLLNFKWELSIGGQTLSKAEFDRLVALNAPLVEINGEWVELRQQDIRAAQTFFTSRKDQMSLSLEDALRISTGDTQVIEKLPVVSFEASGALQELIGTLTTGNESIQPIDHPRNFQGQLRPYQARGAGWLAFLERWGLGACLADDMGLGKTIQFIAFLLHLQEQDALEHPILLVCPTSVVGNWEREVKRFAPGLKVLIHHGDKRAKGKAFAKVAQEHHLIITSYALVYRDIKDLQTVDWQGLVLDEAQNIKNPEARQSQAVRELQAQFRIALTGTPVENRLSELWSIMDFLNPGYLGPKNFFQRRFAVPIERYGDTASLQTLRSLVQPFILRRLKTDRSIIQDLPEKQEMTVFCGLSNEQASLYQKTVEQSLKEIDSSEGIQRKGMILALLMKLKQICNHPAHFLKETLGSNHRSGKLQRLEEMLEEMLLAGEGDRGNAERALIFTQFAEWGKLLKVHLEDYFKREVLLLYGGTTKKQREEMIDRFQHDPQSPKIFILSLKAGGVGLNLTRANHVFHFDRWWNPAVENQATDRVFRIGQTRNVQVHKFVSTGTVEEKIHDLIESKKALAEQVVGAGENWLADLDSDQLRNLLVLDRSAIIDDE